MFFWFSIYIPYFDPLYIPPCLLEIRACMGKCQQQTWHSHRDIPCGCVLVRHPVHNCARTAVLGSVHVRVSSRRIFRVNAHPPAHRSVNPRSYACGITAFLAPPTKSVHALNAPPVFLEECLCVHVRGSFFPKCKPGFME